MQCCTSINLEDQIEATPVRLPGSRNSRALAVFERRSCEVADS